MSLKSKALAAQQLSHVFWGVVEEKPTVRMPIPLGTKT